MMPTRKVKDLPRICTSWDHNPPSHQVFENGVYEHTCSECGKVTVFTVNNPTCGAAGYSRPISEREICQCGRTKWYDALCCEVCWGDGIDYAPR